MISGFVITNLIIVLFFLFVFGMLYLAYREYRFYHHRLNYGEYQEAGRERERREQRRGASQEKKEERKEQRKEQTREEKKDETGNRKYEWTYEDFVREQGKEQRKEQTGKVYRNEGNIAELNNKLIAIRPDVIRIGNYAQQHPEDKEAQAQAREIIARYKELKEARKRFGDTAKASY